MSVQPAAKVCVVCQRDVAGLPRTKDRLGRYFCDPCWKAKTTSFPTSVEVAPELQPDNNTYVAPAFVPDELKSQLSRCEVCRGTFKNQDILREDDHAYCRRCWPSRPGVSKAVEADVPSRQPTEPSPAQGLEPKARPKNQVISAGISVVIVLICTALAVTTFADPESSESAKTTAGVIAVPIAAMFAWTAIEAFRSRATIHHKLTLPILVIVGCVVFRNVLDEQDRADRRKRESGQENRDRNVGDDAADTAASAQRQAKIDYMHSRGWSGPDDQMVADYDRVKAAADYEAYQRRILDK